MSTTKDLMYFTVLIVEDNPVNMTLNKIILKNMFPNATIMEACNGEEAVEVANKEEFDLILMDIMMPVMDGYEATSLIREKGKNVATPIIALTASIMPDEMQKCLLVGFQECVTKPIVREDLFEAMMKLLR